jgi:hypothetical protein
LKAIVLIAAGSLSWGAAAQVTDDAARDKSTIRSDAPARYTVQKGDTLWSIAGKYLDAPWLWAELWEMNKDQIKNPHRLYPGDVIVLSLSGAGTPRLSLERRDDRPTVTLSPKVRESDLPSQEISSIPASDIEPFLTRSFIADASGLVGAGEIVEGRARGRIVRGTNDVVYAIGLTADKGVRWNIFRKGKTIRDIEGNLLGSEFRYLGNAVVERFSTDITEASTIRIVSSSEEISIGDQLLPVPSEVIVNYLPRAPERKAEAFVVSSFRRSVEMGRGEIVVLDQGEKQGVEVGHVLAVYRQVKPIDDPRPEMSREQIIRGFEATTWYKKPNFIKVPDERIGLLFVFRTFDNASYAMALNTTEPINIGDLARNP